MADAIRTTALRRNGIVYVTLDIDADGPPLQLSIGSNGVQVKLKLSALEARELSEKVAAAAKAGLS